MAASGAPEVHGTCAPEFQALRDIFTKYIVSGEENGASIAVNIDGQDVVNLWGGYADNAKSKPWSENTVVNIFSCTKIVSTFAILKLIDTGVVALDDKVSKFWPEFAANGKENIEVRQILAHSSGLAGWSKPMTMADICDLEKSTAALAQQAPLWEPGTAIGYHCWTFGHLVGAIVKGATGMSLKDFVAKELSQPAAADLQIGLPEGDWARCAELQPPPDGGLPPIPPESVAAKILNPFPDPTFISTPTWRNAEVGAVNGHANAQACVRLFSAIPLAGKPGGLFSKKTADLVFQEQIRGVDLFSGMFLRRGAGLALRGDGDTAVDSWLPTGRICLWGGWGGSLGIMDCDRNITISYVMNKMRLESPVTPLALDYLKAIYKGVGVDI